MTEEKLYSAVTHTTPVVYRDFYKIYYRERLKAFSVVSAVIAAALILGAAYLYYNKFPPVWCFIALWIGAVLLVYPRMAYRKPYKRAKDIKQTTHFAFYETYVAEKTNSESTNYNYADLMKVIETNSYFLIFHNINSVSIVTKENVKEGSDGLAKLLKGKTEYKRIKR